MNPTVRLIIGAVIGGAVGFGIYRFVGCRTGACPITANPYISIVVYGLLGAMLMAGK